MTIPISSTTVQLLSPGESDTEAEEWGGAPAHDTGYAPVGQPVRAVLSAPSGAAITGPGASSAENEVRLVADPCPIEADMLVRDAFDGSVYQVSWALSRPEPLAHVVAGLVRVTAST